MALGQPPFMAGGRGRGGDFRDKVDPMDAGNLPDQLLPMSRTLARILRHSAPADGVHRDAEGWCLVNSIMELSEMAEYSQGELDLVIRESFSKDRPRFETRDSADGKLIRATHRRTEGGGPWGGGRSGPRRFEQHRAEPRRGPPIGLGFGFEPRRRPERGRPSFDFDDRPRGGPPRRDQRDTTPPPADRAPQQGEGTTPPAPSKPPPAAGAPSSNPPPRKPASSTSGRGVDKLMLDDPWAGGLNPFSMKAESTQAKQVGVVGKSASQEPDLLELRRGQTTSFESSSSSASTQAPTAVSSGSLGPPTSNHGVGVHPDEGSEAAAQPAAAPPEPAAPPQPQEEDEKHRATSSFGDGRAGGVWQKYADEEGGGAWWHCERAEGSEDGDAAWFLEDKPAPWQKYLDPDTGRCYWFNEATTEFFRL